MHATPRGLLLLVSLGEPPKYLVGGEEWELEAPRGTVHTYYEFLLPHMRDYVGVVISRGLRNPWFGVEKTFPGLILNRGDMR